MINWTSPRQARSLLIALAFLTALFSGTAALAADNDNRHPSDPLEKINRVTFAFNDTLDRWLLRPVAVGYTKVTPRPVQGLISNFFSNLGEVRNFSNALLQFKLRDAGTSGTRFLINSTVGMMGLVDVGSALGLEHRYQDFGLTLARWKVPPGPYLMLPVLGPYNLRAAVGLVPDMQLEPTSLADTRTRLVVQGANGVVRRAGLLAQDRLIFGDRYTFIRDAYLQRRHYLSTGEVPDEDF